MDYVIKKGNNFYYSRRVPKEVREFDPRLYVRIALKTDSRKQATKLALIQNEQIEAYWRKLVGSGQKHSHSTYLDVVQRANAWGFSYYPSNVLAGLPLYEITQRLEAVSKNGFKPPQVQALLGGITAPAIKVDDALTKYFEIAKDKVINKTPEQLRKWRTPRRRAIKNFISVVGNKELQNITRDDLLKFRDWWLDRIRDEDLVTNSANKNLVQLKVVVETVSENMKLNLDVDHLFKKLLLKEDDQGTRPPFETSWLKEKLLKPENLDCLDPQAKWALYSFAETGAGISEQVGLIAEDIYLDCEVPHINITKRKNQALKTQYRPRKIPLVGYALDAFRACPSGFTEYHGKPDYLSLVISNFLRTNGLFPTEEHTLYSLRHSFQDRLLAINAPDRVQADLMGHKFNRPSYGKGPSLSQKLELLAMISLK